MPSELKKEIRFLTYFIPMKLASLNSKNNIDVIVNQFFRELPKRWMLLQNTTGKRRLQISRKTSYISYMTHYRFSNQSNWIYSTPIITLKCTENGRLTSKPAWGHSDKQLKKIIRASSRLICCQLCWSAALVGGLTLWYYFVGLRLMLKKYG